MFPGRLGSGSFQCCCFFVLLFGTIQVAANTQYDPAPGSCRIIGDADVYGQGIRLSYYLQWAAVVFGLWISPESSDRTRTATNILTLSVFINSLRGAKVEKSLMDVEWYIVQYLVFWLLFFNLPTSLRALKSGVGSLIVLLINYCVTIAVPVWLYWSGVHNGQKTGCEPKVFLFASIGAYNPKWLLASKILATFGATFIWAPFLGACVLLWYGFTDWRDEGINDDSDPSYLASSILTFLLLANGSVSVAFVEKTLHANNIVFPNSSLTDSGQLIPFLIGVFSLVSVFWEGLKRLASSL